MLVTEINENEGVIYVALYNSTRNDIYLHNLVHRTQISNG